ncbi:flagellin lysine-N-methylase [Paenibacillus flagellatus]|uniref:Lysine-N-methylase n=1 Tax=Paenibacillus flagellatus TaxID=2211139 RepID=A0A2V5JX21_9BACL|nr:flagellin lysine-N-methylase [Paenibacillus flagellatus]PYI51181.1 lysine-N-methylase [Paenibacillus flagellatus]
MAKKQMMLVPSYMRQFRCIGSDCEDTCCAGWKVDLDRETYKKYNVIREPELKKVVDKSVTRVRSNPTNERFAKIKIDQNNNSCPFLSAERLCSLQLHYGESYLSNTCASFPRVTNFVNDVMERSATMSCPEAARLALLNKDGIEFDEIEEEVLGKSLLHKRLTFSSPATKTKPEQFFWEIRIFTIQILQNRKYSVADRLVLLGMFYQKLNECIETKQLHMIEETIATFAVWIEDNALAETLRDIPSNTAIQMELLKELADERFFAGINSQRYFDSFATFLSGIEYTLTDPVEEIAIRYQDAYENYYKPFMQDKEYILENYLVNYVYKNLLPFGTYKTVYDEFVMLVLHYALIKMNLIGISRFYKEEFSIDHIITLIQSFSKTVEHNNVYLNHAHKLLVQNGYTTMAYMAILIKN